MTTTCSSVVDGLWKFIRPQPSVASKHAAVTDDTATKVVETVVPTETAVAEEKSTTMLVDFKPSLDAWVNETTTKEEVYPPTESSLTESSSAVVGVLNSIEEEEEENEEDVEAKYPSDNEKVEEKPVVEEIVDAEDAGDTGNLIEAEKVEEVLPARSPIVAADQLPAESDEDDDDQISYIEEADICKNTEEEIKESLVEGADIFTEGNASASDSIYEKEEEEYRYLYSSLIFERIGYGRARYEMNIEYCFFPHNIKKTKCKTHKKQL